MDSVFEENEQVTIPYKQRPLKRGISMCEAEVLSSLPQKVWYGNKKCPGLEARRCQLTFLPIEQRAFEKYLFFTEPGTANLKFAFRVRERSLGTQRVKWTVLCTAHLSNGFTLWELAFPLFRKNGSNTPMWRGDPVLGHKPVSHQIYLCFRMKPALQTCPVPLGVRCGNFDKIIFLFYFFKSRTRIWLTRAINSCLWDQAGLETITKNNQQTIDNVVLTSSKH